MDLVVLTAFCAIGGILLGYIVARKTPVLVSVALWVALLALAMVLYAVASASTESAGVNALVALFALVLPFLACGIVSALIGTVARIASAQPADKQA